MLSVSFLVALLAVGDSWAGKGTWSDFIPWNAHATHMILLPTKKLLILNWSRTTQPYHIPVAFKTWLVNGTEDDPGSYDQLVRIPFETAGPPNHNEVFCSGHTLTQDGNVFFAGGHAGINFGTDKCHLFNTQHESWSSLTSMRPYPGPNGIEPGRRWYPSATLLPNGKILVLGGSRFSESGLFYQNDYPEVWDPGTTETRDLVARVREEVRLDPYYPHAFIDPRTSDSDPETFDPIRVLVMGSETGTVGRGEPNRLLDLAPLTWTTWHPPQFQQDPPVRNTKVDYSSSVMIDGKIIRTGGSGTGAEGVEEAREAVDTAIFMDLMKEPVRWLPAPFDPADPSKEGRMAFARKNHTLVALPDGKVLAMAGVLKRNLPSGGESDDDTTHLGRADIIGGFSRNTPEMWDPTSAESQRVPWQLLRAPEERVSRGYHSVSLLLPDARVLVAGGEKYDVIQNGEPRKQQARIFTPPYGGSDSWASKRPSMEIIGGKEFQYGSTLKAQFAGFDDGIARLTLVSLGSTTHAYNQNQRVVFLHTPKQEIMSYSRLHSVDLPKSPNIAPPGYYMLFALDTLGRPSVAEIIRLKDFDLASVVFAEVVRGFPETPVVSSDLRIGLNGYLGNSIESVEDEEGGVHVVELRALLHTDAVAGSRFRLRIEASSSTLANVSADVKRAGPKKPISLKSKVVPRFGPEDTVIDFFAAIDSLDELLTVDDPRMIEVSVRFAGRHPFNLYLDSVEGGIGP